MCISLLSLAPSAQLFSGLGERIDYSTESAIGIPGANPTTSLSAHILPGMAMKQYLYAMKETNLLSEPAVAHWDEQRPISGQPPGESTANSLTTTPVIYSKGLSRQHR
jgi:hypothetical protein